MIKRVLKSVCGNRVAARTLSTSVVITLSVLAMRSVTRQSSTAAVLVHGGKPTIRNTSSLLDEFDTNKEGVSFLQTWHALAPSEESLFNGIWNNEQPQWTRQTVNKSIREWGCNLTDTPFVFVHIGKAGGGLVRARFAAAALEYNRSNWHDPSGDDHYYPVSEHHKAKFCNSLGRNYRLPNSTLWSQSFEGNAPCTATTPIGMALACPQTTLPRGRCMGCDDWNDEHCHTVYVSHNNIGSELHWLPPKYLSKWWHATAWSDNFHPDWKILNVSGCCWCNKGEGFQRPLTFGEYKVAFQNCSIYLAKKWDRRFMTYWKSDMHGHVTSLHPSLDYSPVYASLPARHATVVREPWSWLVSKFFWHRRHLTKVPGTNISLRCDNIEQAIRPLPNPGWAYEDAMNYLAYLCGDDCAIRLERNQLTLKELMLQTEGNLRRSFTVVGLLNETDVFYDMVSTRMAYLDMSLNPSVTGGEHSTRIYEEYDRCRLVFANETFQEEFKKKSPLLTVLDYIYKVAEEVNRFQLEELKQCEGPGGRLSRR